MENSRENQEKLESLEVDSTGECDCGAITFMKGREQFSVLKENINNFFKLDIENFVADYHYVNCNHCVNNWGLDLCACGSGEPIKVCEEGFPECGQPMQVFEG